MAIPRVSGPYAGTTAHPVAGPGQPPVRTPDRTDYSKVPVAHLIGPSPAGWRGPRMGAFPRHRFTPSPAGGGWRGARTGAGSSATHCHA